MTEVLDDRGAAPELPGAYDYADLIREERLDGRLYTDPLVFGDEFDRIWHRGWVYVAHASEVAKPGDYVIRTLGLQPVIVSRDKAGEVNVLLNRCPHRGNRVANDLAGNSMNFRCAYHAWTFANSGELIGVPHPQGYGENFDRSKLGLAKVPRVEIYRGFIFASLSPTGISLDEHLGKSKHLIDRVCEVAPTGEIEVKSGSLKHRMKCNWKMIVENDTDGYHPPFVHSSLYKVSITPKRVARQVIPKPLPEPVVRDWGNGSGELDYTERKRESGPLGWLKRFPQPLIDDYVAKLTERVGPERAMDIALEGPPHATIFPNLFIALSNIVVVQPIAPNQTVQWVTPVTFGGAPALDETIITQSQGGLGPAGLLFADDDEIAERNQLGLAAGNPRWLYLARGLSREQVDDSNGSVVSDQSDETSQRAFWRRYRSEMTDDSPAGVVPDAFEGGCL
jgi:phenylpropionate dioxygenase-like ring-hydroxylating dioxygenase large terminal subunit